MAIKTYTLCSFENNTAYLEIEYNDITFAMNKVTCVNNSNKPITVIRGAFSRVFPANSTTSRNVSAMVFGTITRDSILALWPGNFMVSFG